MKPSKAPTFRGKPCRHGHGRLRFVATLRCVRCSRLKYLQDNPNADRIGKRRKAIAAGRDTYLGRGLHTRASATAAKCSDGRLCGVRPDAVRKSICSDQRPPAGKATGRV